MRNRYLADRASRRYEGMRDGRNPYGSKGGYVVNRGGERGRTRGMDSNYDDSRYDSRYYDPYDYERKGKEYDYHYEQPREYDRPREYEMYGYGIGGVRPRGLYYDKFHEDMRYRRDRNDYDSEDMEKEWEEKMEKWCKKLKEYDKFKTPKEDVLNIARGLGAKFKDYDEKEFLTTYYMMMSDYKSKKLTSPQDYVEMALDFLEDEDSDLKGSEKLSAYYFEIVKADEKED